MFTLQTLPGCEEPFDHGVGKLAGFSLHAGVAARADERHKLEQLCRYTSRPSIAEQRLSLTPNANVCYHGVATIPAGRLTGVSVKSAPTSQSQRRMRPP